MKFFAHSQEEPIHIALVSGHTALVTVDGVELDPMFHKEAVTRGATLKRGAGTDELQSQQMTRAISIRDALREMRDGGQQNDFTKDGKPDLRKLIAKLGFQVGRDEVDALWDELTEDA